MGAAPAFASAGEAIEMARAALGYLAAADAAQLSDEAQAACLRGLEQTDAVAAAARASFLSAFTSGKVKVDASIVDLLRLRSLL